MGDRVGAGQIQKQFVEGNDPRGGHRGGGGGCEGDLEHVRVRHGMVEVKLLCFRLLSPFLKLV